MVAWQDHKLEQRGYAAALWLAMLRGAGDLNQVNIDHLRARDAGAWWIDWFAAPFTALCPAKHLALQ